MSAAEKVVLVTGATSGIGLATVNELARLDANVLVHGRTQQSAEGAVQEVRRLCPQAKLAAVWGDLSSMDEVRALAVEVLKQPRLDVVIHNAGLERWERQVTPQGFEVTFAVNHLAPFLLTQLLVPLLARSRPARVAFLSSVVHGWGVIRWDDLQARAWYSPEPVYYQSKLAAALTSQEFARRLAPLGIEVFLVPPGLTQTNFGRNFRGFPAWWARVVGKAFFRSPQAVAMEVVEVATNERFSGLTGAYVDRLRVGVAAQRARSRADQLRMWNATCELLQWPVDSLPAGPALPTLTLPKPSLGEWLTSVTLGELLGFTSTALIAFVGLTLGGHPQSGFGRMTALLVMAAAGVLEGASLGFFQWRLLRRWLPDLSGRGFVGSTTVIAAGGWAFGMFMPLLGTLIGETPTQAKTANQGPSTALMALFAVVFGAVAGALFGFVQARWLKPHVQQRLPWVLGNVIGWACGLPLAYIAGSLGSSTMEWWQALALSGAAGLGMGGCVALGTFGALRATDARNSDAAVQTMELGT